MKLKKLLKQHSDKQNSNRFLHHDRTSSVGASEVFTCKRRVSFLKHPKDYKQDEGYVDSKGAADRGSLIEDAWIVPAFLKELDGHLDLTLAGKNQRTFVNRFISATPDGLLTNKSDEVEEMDAGQTLGPYESMVLEFKTIDPRVNLTEPKPNHIGQVQVQMGLIKRETNEIPKGAIIYYINASFLDQIKEYFVEPDEGVFKLALDRAFEMMTKHPIDLPAEGMKEGGKECLYCAFSMQCAEFQAERVPDKVEAFLDEDESHELLRMCQGKASAGAAEKMAKEAGKKASAEIKDWLKDRDISLVKEEWGRITWNSRKGRTTVDIDAIEKETGINRDDYQKEGKPGDALTVTLV